MSSKPNFLLLGIDTLRAQNLSCYGYDRKTSPILQEYSSGGALLKWNFTPVIPTQPSFTALLTGTMPNKNGIVSHILLKDCLRGLGQNCASTNVRILSQIMQENGYKTYAVDNLTMMRPYFNRGYNEYLYSSFVDSSDKRTLVTADEINAKLLPLLRRVSDPFFIFTHYWDCHAPYVPPAEFRIFGKSNACGRETTSKMAIRGKDLAWEDHIFSPSSHEDQDLLSMYDGEITYLDDRLNNVFKEMSDLGLEENTIVIVVSDHGESFGTHNTFGHAGLHDTVIHVPLIFRGPGIPKGKKFDMFTQNVDVAPTILDYAGIDTEKYLFDGKSLKPVFSGCNLETTEEILSVECSWQKTRCIRTKKWKLIMSLQKEPRSDNLPEKELYCVEEDPWEETNLFEQELNIAKQLENRIKFLVREECEQSGRKVDIASITPLREGVLS